MDTFDWNELRRLVEEYGHGAVKFILGKGDSEVELSIDSIVFDDETELIEVLMLER